MNTSYRFFLDFLVVVFHRKCLDLILIILKNLGNITIKYFVIRIFIYFYKFCCQREVRNHFGCHTLTGAELEDQGVLGTRLTHWEKRVFEVGKIVN